MTARNVARLARQLNAAPPPSTVIAAVTAVAGNTVTVLAYGAEQTIPLPAGVAVDADDRVLLDVTGNRWTITRTL